MAPKSAFERRAPPFATSTRPASTMSTPEPAPNVLELIDHQDLPAHAEGLSESKTGHGARSARKIGNQRQKERKRPKKKEKEQDQAPVASELSSRLPRPTATTPTASAQPPSHFHSRESRDEFRRHIMQRNATVLASDRQAKLQPKQRDDAPSPAPVPSPQQIELNGLVNELDSTWPPWRIQEKIFPSPAALKPRTRADPRPYLMLEQVQKAIPSSGIAIEDLFKQFEAYRIHNTADDFEGFLFQAGFYDEATSRFYPTALDAWEANYGTQVRDEVDMINAETPTLGVLATDRDPTTDQPIESRSGEVARIASALIKQKDAGWSLFMPSTDDMTAGFPTAEEIETAVSERGICKEDLINLFAHRWSGESELIRLATLMHSMTMSIADSDWCVLWKPCTYPHFGPEDTTAWAWRQDDTTSAWCLLDGFKVDVPEDTAEMLSAEKKRTEIVQTPRYDDRVLATVLREEEAGSDGLADFDVVDGVADSRSADGHDHGVGSGDTGSTKRTTNMIQNNEPSTSQQNEATTVVHISPPPTPQQSHTALFTAENAMPAPGTPAQTPPPPDDNSEWQDVRSRLESVPATRNPKRASAHNRRRIKNKVRLAGRRAAGIEGPEQSRLHNRIRDRVAGRAFAEDLVATVCWLVLLGVLYALCMKPGN
ncbi:hypothetical protein LTR01_005101 [Friedmanniomyces endolithicus]|nr:hypothetical protein LTR01_005101 [Friedmanniomyces endolithicus]